MRKSLVIAAALAAASFCTLTGFDSAKSPEDLLYSYEQALKETDHFTAKPSLDLGFTVTTPADSSQENAKEGVFPFGVDGKGVFEYSRQNGFSLHGEGEATVHLLTMDLPYTADAYVIPDTDADAVLIAGYDEGRGVNWVFLPAELPDSLIAKLSGAEAFDLPRFPITFETASEPVMVGDTSCYALKAQIGWTDLKALVTDALAKGTDNDASAFEIPQQLEQLADQAFGRIVLNVELDLAEDTYLAQRFIISCDETSDWSAIGKLFASYLSGSAASLQTEVKDTSFDIEILWDYEQPVDISIPDEAFAQ